MQPFEDIIKLFARKTVSHIKKTPSKECYFLLDAFFLSYHVVDKLGKTLKILLLHAETCHLRYTHPKTSSCCESLFLRTSLIIDNNIIILQTPGYFRSTAVPYIQDDLVGLGIIDLSITSYV